MKSKQQKKFKKIPLVATTLKLRIIFNGVSYIDYIFIFFWQHSFKTSKTYHLAMLHHTSSYKHSKTLSQVQSFINLDF